MYDVIVIGAGMAGVTAARELARVMEYADAYALYQDDVETVTVNSSQV